MLGGAIAEAGNRRAIRAVDGFPKPAGRREKLWGGPTGGPDTRRAIRAVDLEREQIVATHANIPRRVEVTDHAVNEFERRVRGVVRGRLVRFAALIPALR